MGTVGGNHQRHKEHEEINELFDFLVFFVFFVVHFLFSVFPSSICAIGFSSPRTTTGVPSARWAWPVLTTCAAAGSVPMTSTQPLPWRPVSTGMAWALPA